MSPLFVWLNVLEAVLWLAVAGVALLRFRWFGLAVLLAAFGVSDLVETQTGAWWRPWWLFVWNAGCVTGIVGLLVRARLLARQDAP